MDNNLKTIARASIPVPFAKITPQQPSNKGFTLCKIYVHGCGKNRNYSYMSEEHVREALPTLSYVPVVGHLMPKYDENGKQDGYYFGSHDYMIDDDLKLKPMTVPFGVVIDDSFDFEDVEEYGKTVRYLTCNAYLWTGRWPELKEAVYSEDIWFNQSMEVTDIQYRPLEEDSNYSEFLQWTYSALCLLGKSDDPEYHTEPCFINARVEPVKFDLADNQFGQMMSEMKAEFARCFDKDINEKGGDHLNHEERDAIFAKFNLKAEDVDFEITDDMTAEQLTEKLQEYSDTQAQPDTDPVEPEVNPDSDPVDPETDPETEGNNNPVEPAVDPQPEDVASEQPASFSLTFKEKSEKLDELCQGLNMYEDVGDVHKERYCWMNDFDDEFVYYTENIWTNDDFSRTQRRCKYELPEMGDAKFVGQPEEVFQKWLTAAEIQKLDDDRAQLEALMQFKADAEKKARDAEVSDLFDKFEAISNVEEYSKLKESADNYSIPEIETQLFAMLGRQVKLDKKPQDSNLHVRIVPDEGSVDDGYGGLIQRGRNRNNRNNH